MKKRYGIPQSPLITGANKFIIGKPKIKNNFSKSKVVFVACPPSFVATAINDTKFNRHITAKHIKKTKARRAHHLICTRPLIICYSLIHLLIMFN